MNELLIFLSNGGQRVTPFELSTNATVGDLRSAITKHYPLEEGQYYQILLGNIPLEQESSVHLSDTGISQETTLILKIISLFPAEQLAAIEQLIKEFSQNVVPYSRNIQYYPPGAAAANSVWLCPNYSNCVSRITNIFANAITAKIFWRFWCTQLTPEIHKEEDLREDCVEVSKFSHIFLQHIMKNAHSKKYKEMYAFPKLQRILDGVSLAEHLAIAKPDPVITWHTRDSETETPRWKILATQQNPLSAVFNHLVWSCQVASPLP